MAAKKKPPKPAKRGRPSLSGDIAPGDRSPPIGVRLASNDLGKVDAIAEREGVKRSEMVRRLLLAGIAAHKPGKPSRG